MRYVRTKDLTPGMTVGRDVIGRSGIVLLECGKCLTRNQIGNLFSWGISYLCIQEDGDNVPRQCADFALSRAAFDRKYEEAVWRVRDVFENARHFKQIPVAELRGIVDRMLRPLINTIGVLDYLYEIDLHCEKTFQHSVNVAVITGIFSKWLNYTEEEYDNLVLGGLLHDIGKIFVPLSILHKPGKLNEAEFSTIAKHAEDGYFFIKNSNEIAGGAKMAVLQHHERIDGSGYPFGLVNGDIHGYAKVVAVADIYDAMTSNRSYRAKLTPLEAMETIVGQMNNKLDIRVCLPFLDIMRDHILGSNVLLSDGQKAKIIILPCNGWTKPIVRAHDGRLLDLRKEAVCIVDFLEA